MARIGEELKSSFSSEQHKAMLNVMFTANWFKTAHADQLARHDLSLQQYNILRILRGARGGKVNMHQVKERMIDRAPNATRLTDKLIGKGLIVRERCEEDRRVVYVRIAPSGIELLRKVDRLIEPVMAMVSERLSDKEAMTLNALLDKVRG